MKEPLSRDEIWELAQGVILGPELCTETFAALDAGDEGFWPWTRAHELLKERRSEALAAAKKQKDFLRVKVSDLATEHRGRASEWDEPIFWALDHYLRPDEPDRRATTWNYGPAPLVHWPPKPHPEDPTPHDSSGDLTGALGHLLAEKPLTWIELATKGDKYYFERVQKRVGDPHEPEEMAMHLIQRRLSRVANELSLLYRAFSEERKAFHAEEAVRAEDKAIEDVWSGFFGAAPEPEKPLGRERPVAPQLGDGDAR